MKTYIITRTEKIVSQQVIEARSEKQALKQVEKEGFDESMDEVISSNIEIEENYSKYNCYTDFTHRDIEEIERRKT